MKDMVVANRYAEAVYEEAKASGVLDVVVKDLEGLNALMNSDKSFATLMTSPALRASEKLSVVHAMGKTNKINKLTYAFLVVLAQNKRLGVLPQIFEAINQRIREDRGEVEVSVSFAAPVGDTTRKALTDQLAKITKKKVLLKESVDASLLGGMRVWIGSAMYDASVKGRLDALRNRLTK